jgi:hypothetical protein
VNARKEPVPKASEVIPEHVFVGDPYGYRDPIRQQPMECLFVVGGRRCKFPRENGVHKSSEELVADLPPTPDEDRTKEMTGEGRDE